jgi:hypothetical protein
MTVHAVATTHCHSWTSLNFTWSMQLLAVSNPIEPRRGREKLFTYREFTYHNRAWEVAYHEQPVTYMMSSLRLVLGGTFCLTKCVRQQFDYMMSCFYSFWGWSSGLLHSRSTLEKKILKTGKFMSSVYALKFKSTATTGNPRWGAAKAEKMHSRIEDAPSLRAYDWSTDMSIVNCGLVFALDIKELSRLVWLVRGNMNLITHIVLDMSRDNFARSKTWWMLPEKRQISSKLHWSTDFSNSFSRKFCQIVEIHKREHWISPRYNQLGTHPLTLVWLDAIPECCTYPHNFPCLFSSYIQWHSLRFWH